MALEWASAFRLCSLQLFEKWGLNRRGLFSSPFSGSIVREAFGEVPHGVIQFPKPALWRAIGGLEALCLWYILEVLFIRLIANRILSKWSLLIFDSERLTVQPNHGGMAGERLFSIEFPPAKMHISETIQAAEKARRIKNAV